MTTQYRSRAPARDRSVLRHRLLCTVLASMGLASGLTGSADACDLCAIYTATEVQESRTGFRIGLAEQYTYFGTTRYDGEAVTDADDEEMKSSITQLVLGYNYDERFGAQLNLPFITRHFKRFQDGELESGDETGLGDMTLVGTFAPYGWVGVDTVLRGTVMAGIKLPTGSSSLLREELQAYEDINDVPDFPDEPCRGLPGFYCEPTTQIGESVSAHTTGGENASALHGHDLALGSGSVDGVFGARLFGSWKRLYAAGSVQYFLRSEGDFDYQYADELLWRVGPGVFLALDDVALERGYTLNLAAVFSGETKGNDKIKGSKLDDTAYTGLYLGPELNFTWGESLQISLAGELPVLQKNTELQLVPDYRIFGAFTWRF